MLLSLSTQPGMKQVCLLLLAMLLSGQLRADSWRILHNFGETNGDGYSPGSSLTLNDGTLYGTTPSGGKGGNGTLFKLNLNGTGFTNVHAFAWADGANPGAGVVCSESVLYGTTQSGGDFGNGTVFRVNTDGSGHTVIKSFPVLTPAFSGTNNDGAKPRGDLILDGNTLYGTASTGGGAGNGTLFRINTDGSDFTVLKTFSPTYLGTNNVSGNLLTHGTNADGALPIAGLTLSGSTLYGTTFYGGVNSNGVIFKLNTDGNNFTVLKHFPPLINSTNADGANLRAGLTLSGDTFYGAAVNGGNLSSGTLFRMKTNGTDFAVLKHYYWDDGAFPNIAPIISGSTLYGIAVAGGTARYGVLFKLKTDGSHYTVYRNLTSYSYSRLLLNEGTLLGAISSGGTHGNGVVFAFDVPPDLSYPAMRSDGFAFDVSGVANQTVVIEASPNPSNTSWTPLQTNVLSDAPIPVLDSAAVNYPSRFYRARTQ